MYLFCFTGELTICGGQSGDISAIASIEPKSCERTWPGYQPFGGWKASGSTGKAIGSFYYLPQYLREQSQTIVD